MLYLLTKFDDNDYPTPDGFFHDTICTIRKELYLDMLNMIDLCCTPENKKLQKAYTLKENALFQDWHKDGTCGWMAAPYKGKQVSPFKCHLDADGNKTKRAAQSLFTQKAVEESRHGFITIGLLQSATSQAWFNDFITMNQLCDEIHIEDEGNRLLGGKGGTSLVIFGVKKGYFSFNIKRKLSKIPIAYKKTKKPNKYWNKNNIETPIPTRKPKFLNWLFGPTNIIKPIEPEPIEPEPIEPEPIEPPKIVKVEKPPAEKRKYVKSGNFTKEKIKERKQKSTRKKLSIVSKNVPQKAAACRQGPLNLKKVPKSPKNTLSNAHKTYCWEAVMNGRKWVDAYLIAFPTCGNRRSANASSNQLKKKPHVKKELERLMKIKKQKENRLNTVLNPSDAFFV